MLKEISLTGIGPAPSMTLDFGPGLNILTGDNGLGKTLFLDLAWWALTRTWANLPAWPDPDVKTPSIGFIVDRKSGRDRTKQSYYYSNSMQWKGSSNPFHYPHIVIYAKHDGGFSVWDYLRNYPAENISGKGSMRPEAYHFSAVDLWDGLKDNGHTFCNGLIQDWVKWQYIKKKEFFSLQTALEGLSPHETELLVPGEPIRTSISDVRDIPTIVLPYGTIPVTHASSGMRRILALAYLIIWTIAEHHEAVRLTKREPARQMVFLMDEVESHLHPQWQRVILPAILRVIKTLEPDLEVQVIVSTHAPLVLASVENDFNLEKDRLINFELDQGKVEVMELPWAKQGDVINWLVSDAFDMTQARSLEAEKAIEAAEAFMRKDFDKLPEDLSTRDQIHQELSRVLPGHDPFWPRWIVKG